MSKKIIIIVLVLALLIAGAYVLMDRANSTNSSTEQLTNTSNTETTGNTETAQTQQPQSNADTTNPASTSSAIEIKDFAYSPASVTVKKGTTITWTNQDSMRHDVNPDTPSDSFKKSSLLAKGESYSVTFDTPGTYTYYCSPHPYMKGTVTVTE